MTEIETVDALLEDLTAENQYSILPILADALVDAGFERREQALRYMLLHNKRPFIWGDVQSSDAGLLLGYYAHWRPEDWFSKGTLINSQLPRKFIVELTDDRGQSLGIHGRYYYTVKAAWKAILDAAEDHLELLIKED